MTESNVELWCILAHLKTTVLIEETASVLDLKRKVWKDTYTNPLNEKGLVYRWTRLKDNKTLKQYGIHDGSIVSLLPNDHLERVISRSIIEYEDRLRSE